MHTTHPDPWITRTWLRDGSTNKMPLTAAVKNICHNSESNSQFVRESLLAGQVMYTLRAAFSLEEQ